MLEGRGAPIVAIKIRNNDTLKRHSNVLISIFNHKMFIILESPKVNHIKSSKFQSLALFLPFVSDILLIRLLTKLFPKKKSKYHSFVISISTSKYIYIYIYHCGFIIKNNKVKLKDYFNKYFEKHFRCEIHF